MAFLREPRPEREPIFRAPLSVILLILLIVAAHLARVFLPDAASNEILNRFAFIPARYSPWPHPALPGSFLDGALPFVSYLFLHGNATHLIVNCMWLLAFGAPVARRLGSAAFLGLFFVCGIAAAFAHLAGNWSSSDGAIGASGAIAGIMGAGIRVVWLGDPFGRPEHVPLLPITSRQVFVFSAVWLVGNVLTGATGFGALPGLEHIAWQAHIGGYFAGLLLSGPLDRLVSRTGTDAGITA